MNKDVIERFREKFGEFITLGLHNSVRDERGNIANINSSPDIEQFLLQELEAQKDRICEKIEANKAQNLEDLPEETTDEIVLKTMLKTRNKSLSEAIKIIREI